MATDILAPIAPAAWDARKARHLLTRAGFGVPRSRVDTLAGMSPEAAVASLVDHDVTQETSPPDFLIDPARWLEIRRQARELSEEEQRKARQELQREEREAVQALKAWWLYRMGASSNPLEEKMTLFWHGHFATSAQKVWSSYANWDLNRTFRAHATGNFKRLTIAVGQSPCMLRYLDNNQNHKNKPNENWARELMELFTLGVGNYTEDDIKNSARAFTGWTFDAKGFDYRQEDHDFGEKAFLGRTGDFDGWNIIDIIFEQPAASRFITTKLWKYFVHEQPDEAAIEGLAKTLRESNFELRPMLTQLFLSQVFYSDDVIGNQIKSPAQLVTQLAHDLELDDPPVGYMARALRELDQDLFYPPNVKGWDGNRAWVNATTLLLRYNLPVGMAQAAGQRAKGAAGMAAMTSGDPAMAASGRMTGEGMRAEVREMLASLPADKRRDVVSRLESANPEERRAILREVFRNANRWKAEEVLDGIRFTTAGECVDALTQRLLNRPIAPDQRQILISALGAGAADSPMSPAAVNRSALEAMLHLLFSMAEYQLC